MDDAIVEAAAILHIQVPIAAADKSLLNVVKPVRSLVDNARAEPTKSV
jgi:hypothetical protein